MSKLRKKPTAVIEDVAPRFERFDLSENPFPPEPTVNKDSEDPRINGDIYEMALRQNEFEKIKANYLSASLGEPNHLRLCYIIDTSYIGRGNGKSAFLVNLQQAITREYALDLSEGRNKCFAIYVSPESGGRTKSFSALLDLWFEAILRSRVIEESLASIRLTALNEVAPQNPLNENDEDGYVMDCLRDKSWYEQNGIDLAKVREVMSRNRHLQELPPEFPLFREVRPSGLFHQFVTLEDFAQHYRDLARGRPRFDFLLTHMVHLFRAADFTGAFVLIDDFERIPDFQTRRQMKDFALELRNALFDGSYLNSRIGFFNCFLVLHAGVPPLISEAWAESGLENRSPISQMTDRHVVPFEKLTRAHAELLLKKYLNQYRTRGSRLRGTEPFTPDAVSAIGEASEFNAAKMLQLAYGLLEHAADNDLKSVERTDVDDYRNKDSQSVDSVEPTITSAKTVDLMRKAREGE